MNEPGPSQTLSFDLESLGQPQPWTVHHRGLAYTGEVIIAESFDHQWGEPLPPHLNFRLVFFTVPRRIPPRRILDTRIAMVVPGRSPAQARHSLRRELKSIQETRERYVYQRDPDSDALRKAMLEREESLRGQLERRYGMAYTQGRIYTHPEIGLRAQDVFLDSGLESWANGLASATLLLAHPILPLNYSGFPGPLTARVLGEVFSGLLQGDGRAKEAVDSFAVGLGVSSPENPEVFDASNCPVRAILQRELEGAAGAVDASVLVQTLTLNYGLTLELSLFHLLAFVRQSGGQLLLRPGSRLTSRGGEPFLSDRITRDLVPEIDFDNVKLEQLDELRLDSPISWNLTLPYSSLLVDGLEPLDETADVFEQESRLTESLVTLATDVVAAQASVEELCAGLGSDAQSFIETLMRLQRMSHAESYQEFYSIAEHEFDGPSGLSIALESYRRAVSISDSVPVIIEARNYLDRMTFGQEHQQLRLVRDTLMARMDPTSLLGNPSLWQGIRGGLEGLRNSYAAAYGSFHFEYHQQALELRHLLETLEPQVKALARFNEIPELGEAVGSDVQQLFKDVSEGYRLCSLAEEDLDFSDVPYCRGCILPMNLIIPHRNAEQLSGDVSRAMREYNSRLSSYSAKQILDKPTQEQVDKFIELVQVADPSALANILDDRVVEFLRQFLSSSD